MDFFRLPDINNAPKGMAVALIVIPIPVTETSLIAQHYYLCKHTFCRRAPKEPQIGL